jgi:hypothetical protein
MSWRLWLARLADSLRKDRSRRREASRRRGRGLDSRRAAPLTLDRLEDRTVPSTTLLAPATSTPAGWAGFGGNAQHTSLSSVTAQSLNSIHWQTPVDLDPQYDSGGELLIHYGTPIVTPGNTVIVPVKTGATSGFEIEAFNGASGAVKWTVSTDYQLPQSYDWTPEYAPVLAGNRLYFAGNGGTLYYISNLDSTGAHPVTQVAFYGTAAYDADPSVYNNSIYVSTPLTADANGDIFFGYRVYGSNPSNVQSGIARIDANGNGTSISAYAASGGDGNISQVPFNAAPAVSNDGSTIYESVDSTSQYYGYLVALNSTTLHPEMNASGAPARTFLYDPRDNNANPAGLLDDSTASPMVAPDGTVFYGVFGNPYNGSRGFLLHFSADLSTEYTPGAFGWDDTVSIVPTSMVPQYTGTSSYLLFSKYNNYAGSGAQYDWGNGVNEIAVLDPNATQLDTRNDNDPTLQVMKEVETIAGPTPDAGLRNSQDPDAVHEWCIDTAVVDPATDSVYAGSEDGRLYRWDLATNTLSQVVTLTPGLGEAYTPTLIGPDGTVYAINNATLFAVGNGPTNPAPISLTATGLNFGSQAVGTTSAAPKVTDMVIPGINVNFESVAFSGPNAADFTLLNPPSVTPNALPPGPLQFNFTPSQLGSESATCTITTQQGIITVSLMGTGTTPVRQTGGTVSFGSNLLGITESGTDPGDFSLTNPPALGPLAQGSQVLDFTFTPSVKGSESATYTLQTSAGAVTINLSGSGAVSVKQPAVMLSGTNLQYGIQVVGVTSETLTQTLTVTGSNVQLLGITAGGADPADFTLLNPPATGMLPPGSQVLQFDVTPSQTGSESATYTFQTSAGNYTVSLSANGMSPLLLSANGIKFGSTALTAESAQTLTLTNLDNGGHVQLLSISSTSPNAGDFPLISAPGDGTLAGGAQSIEFGFSPSKTGAESATYVITTSMGSFTVTLNGTGITPISLSTKVVDMGSVPVGTTTEQETAYLYNLGANVTLESVTIGGPNGADFSVSNANSLPTGQVLSQGQTVPLEFTFTPSESKTTETATVTVTTSAGTLTLTLNGVGLVATV